jgi:hypothetical protein
MRVWNGFATISSSYCLKKSTIEPVEVREADTRMSAGAIRLLGPVVWDMMACNGCPSPP